MNGSLVKQQNKGMMQTTDAFAVSKRTSSSLTNIKCNGLKAKRKSAETSTLSEESVSLVISKKSKANNDVGSAFGVNASTVSCPSLQISRRRLSSIPYNKNEQFDKVSQHNKSNDNNNNNKDSHNNKQNEIIKPSTYMITMLHANGHYVRSRPSLSMPDGLFPKINEKRIASYSQDIVNAVRSNDVGKLRQIHHRDGGRSSLSCCNKFGESILHMSCRREYVDIVRFLLDEVGLSLHVTDDYGRTPLHDSMWTSKPNFDLVTMLINGAPELLFLTDKRGCLPFDYVRKDHYGQWITYISDRNIQTFLPKTEEMKKLFLMKVSTAQAEKVDGLIRMNYLEFLRCNNNSLPSSKSLFPSSKHPEDDNDSKKDQPVNSEVTTSISKCGCRTKVSPEEEKERSMRIFTTG